MLCPAGCRNSLQFVSSGVTCRCGYSLAYTGGIADFTGRNEASDGEASSRSAVHPRAFQQLTHVLDRIGKKNVRLAVELGAGNGAWTVGMNRSDRFQEIYAIDASHQSQSMLSQILSKPNTRLVCQSAEHLDFEAGSVDVVVARSFLRHVANYEALLAKCARWLKPDGAAIFYEPCIQGKIWIAFLTKLMLEFEALPAVKWDTMRRNLELLYLKGLERPPSREDKWIFDVDALRETAQAAGFSTVEVIDEDGRLLRGFKRAIFGAISDRSKLARYSAMLEALGVVFSTSAPKMLVSPMVFFVFRKFTPGGKRATKQSTRSRPIQDPDARF